VPRKIGGSVSAPTVLYTVQPEYTEAAKQAKVGGNVLINLWVDEQGNPQHVRVTHGLGRGLDQAAITAVKQYKFKPAMENGQPVLVQLNLEVNFQIF
jgi:protein TonB